MPRVGQQRGGADGNIADLDERNGTRDSTRALHLASEMEQPDSSAIYFAVDWDYFRKSELDLIRPYFERVKEALSGKYLVGVYRLGTVGQHFKNLGPVDHIWLAGATGWSGTERALRDGNWTIFQKYHKRSESGCQRLGQRSVDLTTRMG